MDYSTQTLAQGCFGKIYKQKFGDQWAAMKKVPVNFITEKDLQRECKVYDKARHPNVVKLLGDPWIDDYKWQIPMEFICGEDLETTIFEARKSKIQLTPAVRATIITGMCEGLQHLHSKDIVHQDLKPDNIMVEHQTHRAVIIDLGLAKFFKGGLCSAQNLGNDAYSAPEILQMGGVRDRRSDVWAMGKIIAELCARIRLPTQFVSARKIQETLKDHPYCRAVCRMVETNPDCRAPMGAVISDIRRAASAFQTDIKPRDVTVGQRNEMRANQRRGQQVPALRKMDIKAPPLIKHHQTPPQQREMRKAADVPPNVAGLSDSMSLMSFPCPLPENGIVIQKRFNERNEQIQHKEIVVEGGKVIKYEKKILK